MKHCAFEMPLDAAQAKIVRIARQRLEGGDLSPLLLPGRLVGPAAPRSAARREPATADFDGDKSPLESADKSAHSKRFASLQAPAQIGVLDFRRRITAERTQRWS